MKNIPNIPDAFKDLPDKTKLCSEDISKMFGYNSSHSLNLSFKNGIIPEPDIYLGNLMSGYKIKRAFWKLGTIRKWRELAIAESKKQ